MHWRAGEEFSPALLRSSSRLFKPSLARCAASNTFGSNTITPQVAGMIGREKRENVCFAELARSSKTGERPLFSENASRGVSFRC